MTAPALLNNSTAADVEAERLLRDSGALRLPVDLDVVTKHLGIGVTSDLLDDGISGFLLVKGGRANASLNSKHHPNRQRFTLAHEIGHFVLHHQPLKDAIFIDKSLVYLRGNDGPSRDGKEREADQFAASLLMPRTLLHTYISQQSIDLEEEIDLYRLALACRVSEQALSIRLRELFEAPAHAV